MNPTERCGKRRYPSQAEAADALLSAKIAGALRGKQKRQECRYYPCPDCKGWAPHLQTGEGRVVSAMRDVRRWALSRRINVPDRGLLPLALIEAFNAAHPDDPCPLPKVLQRNLARWGHPNATPEELAEQRRLGGKNRHR